MKVLNIQFDISWHTWRYKTNFRFSFRNCWIIWCDL